MTGPSEHGQPSDVGVGQPSEVGVDTVEVIVTDERDEPDPQPRPTDWQNTSAANDALAAVIADVMSGEGVTTGTVEMTFVDLDTMTELNVTHMGGIGPTDVLSFPMDDPDEPTLAGVPTLIGQIAICPDIAAAQAAEHAGSIEAELHLLAIHGALHLVGHDHHDESEAEIMRAREAHHLLAHGFDHPGPQT